MKRVPQSTVVLPLPGREMDEQLALERDGIGRPIGMMLSAKVKDIQSSVKVN